MEWALLALFTIHQNQCSPGSKCSIINTMYFYIILNVACDVERSLQLLNQNKLTGLECIGPTKILKIYGDHIVNPITLIIHKDRQIFHLHKCHSADVFPYTFKNCITQNEP